MDSRPRGAGLAAGSCRHGRRMGRSQHTVASTVASTPALAKPRAYRVATGYVFQENMSPMMNDSDQTSSMTLRVFLSWPLDGLRPAGPVHVVEWHFSGRGKATQPMTMTGAAGLMMCFVGLINHGKKQLLSKLVI
jgi:hypothetical protein